MDDALNSNENGSSLYDELYQEFVGNGGDAGRRGDNEMTGGTKVQGRRAYAALNIGSMGVDVTQGPLTKDPSNLRAADNIENYNHG